MDQTKIDVAYIAKLARIDLTEQETESFTKDLDKILDYIDTLNSYDVSDVEPMFHPVPLMDVLRDDKVGESFEQEAVLNNAPQEGQGQIRTP